MKRFLENVGGKRIYEINFYFFGCPKSPQFTFLQILLIRMIDYQPYSVNKGEMSLIINSRTESGN